MSIERGVDWTAKYPAIVAALKRLPVERAYLDGELCGVRSFMVQNASDVGYSGALVFFLFDLLSIGDEDLTRMPLVDRKARLTDPV